MREKKIQQQQNIYYYIFITKFKSNQPLILVYKLLLSILFEFKGDIALFYEKIIEI